MPLFHGISWASPARSLRLAILTLALLVLGTALSWSQDPLIDRGFKPMPEFTSHEPHDWINSAPLTLADLKGKVVLIEIWTTT